MTTRSRLPARLSRLATALFVIALPVFLVTTNVRVLASEVRFYEEGFRRHDSDIATGIEMAELDRAARQIVEYFSNDADTLRIVVIEDGEEAALFDAREAQHMQDVKGLMQAVYRLNEVSLAVLLIYVGAVVLWARERSGRDLARSSLLGVGVGVAAVAFVGVFALTGFDSAWTMFHEIAFRNDLWQLDPDTDHLIQMFPEPLWEEATYLVGALTIAEVAVVVIAATTTLLVSRKRQGPGRTRPAASVAPGSENTGELASTRREP